VAAVDEQRGALGEYDGAARRSREAREPGEPLVGRGHVFVLVAVGARHDEAVEAAPRELGTQRLDARPARRAVRWIVERLKSCRHDATLYGAGPLTAMPGTTAPSCPALCSLLPGIHVYLRRWRPKTWMAGT